jgi:hypothetical protein
MVMQTKHFRKEIDFVQDHILAIASSRVQAERSRSAMEREPCLDQEYAGYQRSTCNMRFDYGFRHKVSQPSAQRGNIHPNSPTTFSTSSKILSDLFSTFVTF